MNCLTKIDLSSYVNLEYLWLQGNMLTELDLSNQLNLVHLGAWSNNLSTLELFSGDKLIHLEVDYNALSSLDVTGNPNLQVLWVSGNPLDQLDLSQNSQLGTLHASGLDVNELDFSNLVNLENLYIASTAISNLDFSQLISLNTVDVSWVEESLIPWEQLYHVSSLSIGGQNYTSFDFSGFTNLTNLAVYDSFITDFSTIPNPQQLETLRIWKNSALTQLDISAMTSLQILYLENTAVTTMDFFNNANLVDVHARNNSLNTVVGIEAIAYNYANLYFERNPLTNETQAYLDDLRDNQGYYNITYSISYNVTVNVIGNGTASESNFTLSDGESRGVNLYPDSGYEVASVTGCDGTWHSANYYEVGPLTSSCEIDVEFVVAIPLADKAGITDPVLAQCVNNSGYTRLEETTSMSCYSNEINSLDGLEAFPNLNGLHVVNLNVGEVPDLSSLTALTNISIINSNITGIMVYDSLLIERLNLSNNALTSFDVSLYSNLKELNLQFNQLSSLDMTNNTLLEVITLNINPLTNLVMNSANLLDLSVSHTDLTGLDLTQNVELDYLDISHTPGLAGFDLSNLTKLRVLNIGGLDQSLINNGQFPSVESLYVSYANLTSFDTTGLDNLKYLNLEGNQIADFSQVIIDKPAQLLNLNISQNPLTELDMSKFSNLTTLLINETNITNIDFTYYIALNYISANNSMITTVAGIESLTVGTNAYISFGRTPLSTETINYLADLRDNQGYSNLYYSVAYPVLINVTGNGYVNINRLNLSESETTDIYLYPDTGFEIGSVTGCDGTLETNYYSIGPITESCEVNVEFVETML